MKTNLKIAAAALFTFTCILLFAAIEVNKSLQEQKYWFGKILQILVSLTVLVFPASIAWWFKIEPIFSRLFRGRHLENVEDPEDEKKPETHYNWRLLLFCCFLGIQLFFVTQGLLQRKFIQIREFKTPEFLVFTNRLTSLGMAILWLKIAKIRLKKPPYYKFSVCALSNMMSSVCQYEALKYVSFTLQVMSKSCKVVPVMIMGLIMSNCNMKKYKANEWLVGCIFSIGMAVFFYSSKDVKTVDNTISGCILLLIYITLDTFTPNKQKEIYQEFKITSAEMMCFVNLFACIFMGLHLLINGGFYDGLKNMIADPYLALELGTLALCSALGQVCIYQTLKYFDPVMLSFLMALKQIILVSITMIFSEDGSGLSWVAVTGICIVFIGVMANIGFKFKNQKEKSKLSPDEEQGLNATNPEQTQNKDF